MKNFLKEFKDFAIKGNAIELAVGVVIGGAFGKIVTSLVNDIIMPFVSLITGAVNFADMKWLIRTTSDGTEVFLTYGNFIQSGVDFLLTAFAIFMVIRALNKVSKKKEEVVEEKVVEEKPSEEIVLLQNILKELQK